MSMFDFFHADDAGMYHADGDHVFHDGMAVDHVLHDGHTILDNSDIVTQTHSDHGTVDTFVNGILQSHSVHNGHGGLDTYHDGQLVHHSVDTGHGTDFFDGDMAYLGHAMPDGHGGEDYLAVVGNAHEIMRFDDPLVHANAYQMEPFDCAGRP